MAGVICGHWYFLIYDKLFEFLNYHANANDCLDRDGAGFSGAENLLFLSIISSIAQRLPSDHNAISPGIIGYRNSWPFLQENMIWHQYKLQISSNLHMILFWSLESLDCVPLSLCPCCLVCCVLCIHIIVCLFCMCVYFRRISHSFNSRTMGPILTIWNAGIKTQSASNSVGGTPARLLFCRRDKWLRLAQI